MRTIHKSGQKSRQKSGKNPAAKILALALSVAMLLSIAITATAAPAYPDIAGHWGEAAIEKWSALDVLHGNDLGTFDPDGELDVTQLAQILVNTFGYTASFSGALPGYTSVWGEEEVRKAVAAGAIEASEAALPLTRELAAKIVAKAFGIAPVTGASKFSDDYAVSAKYKPYAAALGKAGIFNGSDGEFMPTGVFSRAQIMQALDNAVTDIVKENKAAESSKSVILNKGGVTLSEGTIEGDLIIAQGVGDGDITLDGVTINGRLVIFGGGANSIHVKGKSSIANVTIAKTFGQAARFVVESADASVGTVTVVAESKATVATTNGAEIAKIEVAPATEVTATGEVAAAEVTEATTVTIAAKAAEVEIAAENAALTISSGATIASLTVETKAAVTVASGATVTEATIAASDVTVAGSGKVTTVTVTGESTTAVTVTVPNAKIENDSGASVSVGGGKTVTAGGTGSVASSGSDSSGGTGGDITIPPVITYTVTFESNGGSAVAQARVNSGGKVAEPDPAPTKEHYIFDGWYTDDTFATKYNFDSQVTGNITLNAKWKPHLGSDHHGTINIVLDRSTGELSVDTSQIINGSDEYTYVWSGAGVDGTVDAVTYDASVNGLGNEITLTVTNSAMDGEQIATITPYKVTLAPSEATGADAASIAAPYGEIGDDVTITYTLDDTGTQSNALTFSGADSIPAQITTPGTSTTTYTISADDAAEGVIALTATFEHTAWPDLTGTPTITVDATTGILTAVTSGLSGGSGGYTYAWSGTGVTGTVDTATYNASENGLGNEITVTIGRADATGTKTATITPYKVTLTPIGATGTDAASIAAPYGEIGDNVTITYVLDSNGPQRNTLTFSGVSDNPAQITTSGTSTTTYTIAAVDAASGVIALTATFEHGYNENVAATISGTTYETLQAALIAAKNNETVVVEKDIDVSAQLTVTAANASDKITISGRGFDGKIHTLMLGAGYQVDAGGATGMFDITKGDITFTDIVLDGNNKDRLIHSNSRDVAVTIDQGTMITKGQNNAGSAIRTRQNATLTIKGGEIYGCKVLDHNKYPEGANYAWGVVISFDNTAGTFTMTDGNIYDNECWGTGAIWIGSQALFVMEGGTILTANEHDFNGSWTNSKKYNVPVSVYLNMNSAGAAVGEERIHQITGGTIDAILVGYDTSGKKAAVNIAANTVGKALILTSNDGTNETVTTVGGDGGKVPAGKYTGGLATAVVEEPSV